MANESIMAGLLQEAYLEVIPTRTILDRLHFLSPGAYLAITCSPATGMDPTLDLVDELRASGRYKDLNLIPHIASRVVRDKKHLRSILDRLQAARIDSVFVPGGDAPEPFGEYTNSLDLLRDMDEIGHDFRFVGVASHPEGHPLVDNDELIRLMQEKQRYANYLVTQMCFDPDALITWLRKIRGAGVTMPAWLGLPGVAEISKLISLSMRIGVGQSISVLKKQKGLVRKLMTAKPYQPDELLQGLMPHLDDPVLDIPGFHLFSFNNVEKTERWRVDTMHQLRGDKY